MGEWRSLPCSACGRTDDENIDLVDQATARAERAEAALQRVRALHVRMADSVAERLGFTVPDLCKADYNTWPCPTIAALDSTDPEPAPKEQANG